MVIDGVLDVELLDDVGEVAVAWLPERDLVLVPPGLRAGAQPRCRDGTVCCDRGPERRRSVWLAKRLGGGFAPDARLAVARSSQGNTWRLAAGESPLPTAAD